VWHEVVIQGAGRAGAQEIGAASWIGVQPAHNRQLVQASRHELDAGESEAIALALEVQSEYLLMDEHLGRAIAAHTGVRCIGLLGSRSRPSERG